MFVGTRATECGFTVFSGPCPTSSCLFRSPRWLVSSLGRDCSSPARLPRFPLVAWWTLFPGSECLATPPTPPTPGFPVPQQGVSKLPAFQCPKRPRAGPLVFSFLWVGKEGESNPLIVSWSETEFSAAFDSPVGHPAGADAASRTEMFVPSPGLGKGRSVGAQYLCLRNSTTARWESRLQKEIGSVY